VGGVYLNILTMHGSINVKSPNNISKWQMGFNSAFKGLRKETANFLTQRERKRDRIIRFKLDHRTTVSQFSGLFWVEFTRWL
jgi:hypothetical protein